MKFDKKLLGKYQNGNYKVALFDDGTKIRWNDLNHFDAKFPEAMDVKITNYCNADCPMCFEGSSIVGKHGNLNHPIFDSLQPYTELAIGGGNPLSHPQLIPFLKRMADQKVVCNITVNLEHFRRNIPLLMDLCNVGFLHGVGISVNRPVMKGELDAIKMIPNAVIHTIVGYTSPDVYASLSGHDLRLLFLGYKRQNRGSDWAVDSLHTLQMEHNISYLHTVLKDLKNDFKMLCFDNKAVEQLNVKGMLTPEEWSMYYMGEDGQFTMYLDMVEEKYGVSSTDERHDIPKYADIFTVFDLVKQEAKHKKEMKE